MAAILKTDLHSKLEHWKLSLRCANANSISRRRRKQEKHIFRDLRHLIFQVSVISCCKTEPTNRKIKLVDIRRISVRTEPRWRRLTRNDVICKRKISIGLRPRSIYFLMHYCNFKYQSYESTDSNNKRSWRLTNNGSCLHNNGIYVCSGNANDNKGQ